MEKEESGTDESSTGGLLIDEPVAKILPVDEAVEQVSERKTRKRKLVALVHKADADADGEQLTESCSEKEEEEETTESETASSDSEPVRKLAPRRQSTPCRPTDSKKKSTRPAATKRAPAKKSPPKKPPAKKSPGKKQRKAPAKRKETTTRGVARRRR